MDGRTTLFIGVPPILYWSKLLKGRKTMNLLNSRGGGIATITKKVARAQENGPRHLDDNFRAASGPAQLDYNRSSNGEALLYPQVLFSPEGGRVRRGVQP